MQKVPPPPGGDLTLVSKISKLFLQITIGEMKKVPQAKIFVIGTVFTPKIAQKCKKMANRKFTPPMGGTENVFILGIPPGRGGGLQKIPPHGGDLPPPHLHGICHGNCALR